MVTLQGDGFILRPWKIEDLDDCYRNMNNENVCRNLLRVVYPVDKENTREWIANTLNENNPKHAKFAIEIDGELVGGVAFHEPHECDEGEVRIGYWLAEQHWNKGIMTQAVKLLTDYGFEKLGIKSVSACTFIQNPASARVLEKNGFEFKGTIKGCYEKNGEKIDARKHIKFNTAHIENS